MSVLRCAIGLLVTPAFLCLTVVALCSALVPFLKQLALHGKTRSQTSKNGVKQTKPFPSSTVESWLSKYWQFFLHDDALLINKRYFLHFYVAGLASLAFFLPYSPNDCIRWDLVFLLSIHLLRRCYECVMIHKYSKTSQMHLAGYVCGLVHYLFLPYLLLDITCPQTGTTTMEANFENTAISKSTNLPLWGGTILCLWAQYEQYYHHCLLASLRSPTTSNERDNTIRKRHQIPMGRWFHLVSCPHYLAEIFIYVAFAWMLQSGKGPMENDAELSSCISTGMDVPSHFNEFLNSLVILRTFRHYVLLVWVASNLTVTALRSHQWYMQMFPIYRTLGRKAIFPGIL